MKCLYLFFIPFVLFVSINQLTAQSSVYYSHTPSGKVTFSLSTDYLNLKFEEGVSIEQQLSFLQTYAVLNSIESKDLTLFNHHLYVKLPQSISKMEVKSLLDKLQNTSIIEIAIPMLVMDNGKRCTYDEQFIVGLKQPSDLDLLKQMAVLNHLELVKQAKYDNKQWFLKTTPQSGSDAMTMANVFAESALFAYAEIDFIYFSNLSTAPSTLTTDPLYAEQWHLENTGAYPQLPPFNTVDADIDAATAWMTTTGNPNIRVAVIDDGVDTNNADLMANLEPGYDATAGGETTSMTSIVGHGNSVAELIAAEGNNNIGGVGVAYDCKVIPVKIFTPFGAGVLTRDSWAADAIDWAWKEGHADVLNNSWGGGASSSLINNAIDRAFTQGRSGLGTLSLFSAGNDDINGVEYPANLTNVIAVAATNSCDYRRRPTNAPSCDGSVDWGSNYGIELDVAAPGNLIQTSSGAFSGTSASCPITAGIIALILSKNPSLTATQARFYLESTCEKVNYTYLNNVAGHLNGSWTLDLGYGRVNAALALAAVPTPHPNDLGVVAVNPPANSCNLGMSEMVTVMIKNYSFNTLSGIPIEYRVQLNTGSFGAWMSAGTYATAISPFSEVNHNFIIDASVVGQYTIEVRTQAIGDLVALNDSSSADFIHRSTVASYPYLEDFETNDGDWYTSTANNPFQWGIPSANNNFINTVGSGNKCWYTNDPGSSSRYFPSQTVTYLYSPCLDFSGLANDPILSFLLIYNLEGIPNGQVGAEDYVYMEISTNDGNVWTPLGMQGSGINWYNHADGWAESTQSGAGNWLTASQTLTATAGFSNVQLRFVFPSDSDIPTEDGFALDKIEIKESLLNDAAINTIISPINDCDLSITEIVEVTIANRGVNAITSCPVEYRYDQNGMGFSSWIAAGSYNGMIASGTEDVFFFNADFSLKGAYVLEIRTQLPGDGDATNDMVAHTFEHYTAINTFPYSDSFEAGQGFWLAGGTNSSWDIGNPSGNHISTASDGFTAWVTNLTGIPNDGEQSYVQSPCFDFSALTSPQVNLAVWWDNFTDGDGARLEFSTDDGNTWTAVGTYNAPNNWYNREFVSGLNNNAAWSGTAATGSGGWVTASHGLSSLAGEQQVLFRIYFGENPFNAPSAGLDGFAFDNMIVSESNSADAGVLSINSPAPLGCSLGNAETVRIKIKNFGVTDIMNIPVEYRLDYDNGGFSSWMSAGTYAGTITSGNSATHTFTADFSLIGAYVLEVKTVLPADANVSNDVATKNVENIVNVISFFSHCEDFESGFNGWQPMGTNSSWDTGVPANTLINSAAGGSKVCATNLGSDYNLNESSFLLSPCLDLSMFNFGIISFDVWYETESAKDGLKLQYSIDGGESWVTETIQTNTYNTPTITSFAGYDSQGGWSGSSGGWVHAQAYINPIGASNVFYRFVFVADAMTTGEGVAIDNICLYEVDNNNISAMPGCNTYQLYNVSGVEQYYFVDQTGSTIAYLSPNGNDLGKVTIKVDDFVSVPQANGGVYYLPRYFNLECSGGSDCPASGNFPQGNVDIGLFYESQELAVYNTAISGSYLYSDLYGTHYDGVNENCNLNDNTGGTYSLINKNDISSLDYNMGAGFVLEMSLPAFSEIGVHGTNMVLSPNTALPIELLGFKAQLLTPKTVLVKWITALEENMDRFVIQRSTNGIDFENIDEVPAKGKPFEQMHYQFIDQYPNKNKNYYRLKIIDNDGRFTYSSLELILIEGDKNIQVWPIPFNDVVQYEFYYTNTEKIELSIIGIDGKRWKQEQIIVNKGQNKGQLQLNDLPKGIYMLIAKGEKDRIMPVKIIKY